MKLKSLPIAFAAMVTCCALPAQITLPPGYFVTSVTAGAAVGVAGNLGGIEFSADGLTLYVAGGANGAGGTINAIPVTRDPVTHSVNGMGIGSIVALAPSNDGGLQFGPSGTLFFTTFPTNSLGEIVGGTTSVFPLPVESNTTGGLTFVPPGLPNAGSLIVSSYSGGSMYTVGLSANGGGTYTPTTATLFATLPGGTEGFRFIPSGPNAGDVIFMNYALAAVNILSINHTTGQPVGGAATPSFAPFATGIGGAEGFAFDPITNDLFISTYGSNTIIQIGGFPAPQFPIAMNIPTIPLAGGVRHISVQAGQQAANRGYLIIAGTSGTSPGLTFGYLHVDLNLDDFSNLMLPLVNTPLFMNFGGTTDAMGNATATMNIPPIPPVGLGITLYFAGALVNPVNATSTTTQLTIVP